MSNRARVLHVDDDPDVTELTNRLLDPEGDRLELTNAESGEEGLELLEDGEFDCVVSDSVTLPDGRLFASVVRERDASLPLVLFSGKSNAAILDEARRTDASGYVQKAGVESFERLERVVDESLLLADDGWELLAHHDWDGTQELVTTIASALETYSGVAATEGAPLFEAVDPDALEGLLGPAADGSHHESVSVRFSYRGLVFALFCDGRVLVRPQ
ncbi:MULTISPECIES: HalOD1 output domain-containing protein [Haloprofundus]|uniref:HalOD1 output domain-containing protein n=1 Tax=Haloprofundus TaxID=1911573 RepID=UPI000E45355D|nr:MULTISPECIES: HalOD1 output domain-containing protein [Haloprofundus]QCJ46269.1 response regulator [Haloprofundus sp. MHR1]